MTRQSISIICAIFFVMGTAQAKVFDTLQAAPLFGHPHIRSTNRPSWVGGDLFFVRGSSSHTPTSTRGDLYSTLFGEYDLAHLARSVVSVGLADTNPLSAEWSTAAEIQWNMAGRISMVGTSLGFHQSFGVLGDSSFIKKLSVGGSISVFKVREAVDLTLSSDARSSLRLGPGDEALLRTQQEAIHKLIDITSLSRSSIQASDLDLYIRFGSMLDYEYKVRMLDLGCSLGMLAPLAPNKPIENAAALALGGDGHWGTYLAFDAGAELKEDLRVGGMVRLSKRFAKAKRRRMILKEEPINFGTIIGDASVSPGLTTAVQLWLAFDAMRNGFGIEGIYTYVNHGKDSWTDKRATTGGVTPDLAKMKRWSDWRSEHATVLAFYDFGYESEEPSGLPRVSLSWDIPVNLMSPMRATRAHRVEFSVGASF